jgi:starch phosphorylase
MATLQVPAIGYGIRYEFGIFDQQIKNGWQVEITDKWLRNGNPWEIHRPGITFTIKLGGHTEHVTDDDGHYHVEWIPARHVKGVAYDTPVMGYLVNNANLLRLWSAEAPKSFDFQAFNKGDYYRAVDAKVVSENLTKVLYPNDGPAGGRELRLEQQYFLASCSLQDMIRIFRQMDDRLDRFHEKYVVQLNDTHPSIAIVELMRLLVDEHAMDWDAAWEVTHRSFAYTNHTLLPEALEKWPVSLFEKILPRHLEIIYEINRRFLEDVRQQFPGDEGIVSHLSLIEESGERYVRMANLACVGSFSINGVAALHTQLLKELNNPGLCRLICDALGGDHWVRNLDELRRLEMFVDDARFRERWRGVKQGNKLALAGFIQRQTGAVVDPQTLFDIHVKRIHEYKRQHLKVLHIITLYNRLKQNPELDIVPRTFIFGGKAAPGYYMAKLIIKLINSVAEVIDSDQDVQGRLKVVFVPDYNVKNSRLIYPAADLSEQLSLAGKEASGTGNMKFSMNGALTISTMDGANIEIREEVGAENFFLFGLTAAEVTQKKAVGYRALTYYQGNEQLRAAIDLIASGHFSRGDRELFRPLVDSLLYNDEYLLFADYQSYIDAQDEVEHTWCDTDLWSRMSILNVARMGRFSSDRAVLEYCKDIWHISPLPINM